MPSKAPVLRMLGIALCMWLAGEGAVVAGEDKPPAPTAEQLREALKGFRGYLAGDVVARDGAGLVLLVRSVTLVEGSQARNPGLLLGRETPIRYATEKDEQGKERPMKSLVELMTRLEKLPTFAFGGMGGGDVVIALGDGGGAVGGGADVQIHRMTVKAATMRMEMNGQRIQIEGDEPAAQPAARHEKPRGPAATLRVQATDDGSLVADRALPGMQPAATWDGMAKLRIEAVEGPKKPGAHEPPKPSKDTQF